MAGVGRDVEGRRLVAAAQLVGTRTEVVVLDREQQAAFQIIAG